MIRKLLFLTLLIASFAAFAQNGESAEAQDEAVAYFAGGCFWCTEADFEKLEGVSEVISGYMGGTTENPTYKEVSRNNTGHRETVEVRYNPAEISYQELLDAFWRMHDPTDAGGSFVDRGESYTSAIYYANEEQKRLAEGSKQALENSDKFGDDLATVIEDGGTFYAAEDYHQDYYKKNSLSYSFYRQNSGRDRFINRNWKGDDVVYQLEENLMGQAN